MNKLYELPSHAEIISYETKAPTNPLVTVSIVTYNHDKYIGECIESVLNQKTNFDFEILIGEDDSTDGTREICIEYAKKFPEKIRLFLHNRKNVISIGGQPTGRFNTLYNIYAAKGEYYAFCEGDDYWLASDKLQKQVDFLTDHPSYAGSFHDTYILLNNEISKTPFRDHHKKDVTTEDTIASLAPFHTSSFICRTKALALPYWIDQVFSADMAFFSIVTKLGPLRHIENIASVYRKHDHGITNQRLSKGIFFHLQRIKLLSLINTYHSRKFEKRIQQIKLRHKKEILVIFWRAIKKFIKRTDSKY